MNEPVYNYTLSPNTQFQHFDKLEPFRNYTISVMVISGDKKSAAIQNSTFTMIDRKLHLLVFTGDKNHETQTQIYKTL